jgi:ApaG protein
MIAATDHAVERGQMARSTEADGMYERETGGVKISVEPDYLEDESAPEECRYVWTYTVAIENCTETPIQLIARKWAITDAHGRTEHVQGLGVVGEQPVIEPGECYRYTSGAPLGTSSGFMRGSYQLRTENGDDVVAQIPDFSLDRPDDRMCLH